MHTLLLAFLLPVLGRSQAGAPASLGRYDVVWDSPSEDSAGSMPIGNGEVVLNVWVERTTGDLLFYIARTDAISEISRFLKLGCVRVHVDGSPFLEGDFRQQLHLKDGTITVAGPAGRLLVFVDSQANVVHVTGSFKQPHRIETRVECWRNAERALPRDEQGSAWSVHDAPFPLVESADVFLPSAGLVTWYHRNETSVVPKLWENQTLTGLPGAFDPILHRTFGGQLVGVGLVASGDRSLVSPGAVTSLDLKVATHCAQTDTSQGWVAGVAKELAKSPTGRAETRTRRWWSDFWDRSWVLARSPTEEAVTDTVTRGYVLQRYVQACQGRGAYPIKFNGGFYTVEPKHMGKPFNADFRNWGDSHWYQNIRHMYHPMLAMGDTEMMEPFFRLYESARPLAESRTKAYHGCTGAYFPETMSVFGTYSGGDYGWDRTGLQPKDVQCPWWQWAWNQGPELVALMLDRWDYTRDKGFLKERTLPMAVSVLKYFDTRFKKDAAGKIVLDPTQSVETYWENVVNDMPSTAGLLAITHRLCSLPADLVSTDQKAFFGHMRDACPDLPLQDSAEGRELAPAQKYQSNRHNVENPELYAVWPFQVVSLGHTKLLAEAKRAYIARKEHLDVGWGYDGNVAALLGMTDEAKRILVKKCENSRAGYRWPATWGPNFDWLPDQNHGGNLLETANLMLLQGEPLEMGGAIRLLPAWPRDWDVEFKLHAPGNTVVRCSVKAGKIQELAVSPSSRVKDVVFPNWAKVN